MGLGDGVLSFTLGLSTGEFLSHLGGASRAIDAFKDKAVDTAKGIGAAMMAAAPELAIFFGEFEAGKGIAEGVFHAFEKGAGLEALHKRTSESVSSLYGLQEGFK